MEEAASRAAKAGPKEIGDIDTDDDMDEAAEQQEYELWKARELARIRCAKLRRPLWNKVTASYDASCCNRQATHKHCNSAKCLVVGSGRQPAQVHREAIPGCLEKVRAWWRGLTAL